jgi:hypothetical protein
LKHLIASQSLPFGIHGSDFQPHGIPSVAKWQGLADSSRGYHPLRLDQCQTKQEKLKRMQNAADGFHWNDC